MIIKLVLIIGLLLLTIFISTFVAGWVSATIQGSDKKRRAFAIVTISQLSDEERKNLVKIFVAFKEKNIDKVNQIAEPVSQALLDICSPNNRPAQFSSGKFGDSLSWTVNETRFRELGYSENASRILTGIVLNDYDSVLNKIANNQTNK